MKAIRLAASNSAQLSASGCWIAWFLPMGTHGGMGYAKEFHVERYLREIMIPRIAPISPHLILSFIAEKVLDLPKSY